MSKKSLPFGWKMKKLGEVCDVRDGTHDSPKYQVNGYPLITSKNLKRDGLNFDNVKYISETDYSQINKRSAVHKGDILFAMIGTIGNPIIVEIEPKFAIKNVALFKIPSNLNNYFLKYYFELESVIIKMLQEAKGTTQKFVGLGYLRSFPVFLPPLPEQKRIVKILDQAFAAIDKAKANAEKNLQNSRELFDSYLNKVFANPGVNWQMKKLGEIADIKGGKRVPKGYKLETNQTKYPYIRVTDFNDNGSVDLDDIHYISEEIYNQIQNYFITTKDLYISIAGTIGKSGIIPKQLEGANLTENACKLVFKSSIDPKFVYYFTKSRNFLNQAGLNTRVAAMPKLALTRLSTISLFIPNSLSEQKRIVSELSTLSVETKKLETIYQQKLTDLTELKKSILQKAFDGQL